MRRKALVLAALAAVAAAAVIGGLATTAFSPGGSSTAKPSGKETRIRIQPQAERVACSGEKQAVDMFLDDLGARHASNGLAAFQLTLLYDPSILRVEKPEDAQMNPALTSAQTAGGMRAFIPAPVTIDNLEGWVFFGAVGIPQGEPFNPAVPGIDPVARGEPILLFTVSFQTVGEGTSPLSVYRPEAQGERAFVPEMEVLDHGGQEYAPVVITDSSVTVTAGKCAPALPVTPRPTQVLPTPFPTPTPVIVPTPQQVTPVPAAEAGRPDCPQGWNAYDDPDDHFSFCYPAAIAITTRGTVRPKLEGDSVNVLTPRGDAPGISANGFFIAMGWDTYPKFNPTVPLAQLCPGTPLLIFQDNSVPVEIQIAGRKAVGCAATGSDEGLGPPMRVVSLAIPVSSTGGSEKGYVNFMVRYVGPDLVAAEAAARAVIDTLVIPER
jgi:hypothetical protein